MELTRLIGDHLADGETVEATHDLRTGVMVLTDRRLIAFTVKGWVRKRMQYASIPYNNIDSVALGDLVPLLFVTTGGKEVVSWAQG
jgi:hypothetical protein